MTHREFTVGHREFTVKHEGIEKTMSIKGFDLCLITGLPPGQPGCECINCRGQRQEDSRPSPEELQEKNTGRQGGDNANR